MTQPRYDETILSDLYKDAYGFRPREHFWASWSAMTVEERNAEWLMLCDALDQAIDEERARKEVAERLFEDQVATNLTLGAPDRHTAIRWLLEAHNLHEERDPSYICYCLDLDYQLEDTFRPFVG
jgi:hypothetical protein